MFRKMTPGFLICFLTESFLSDVQMESAKYAVDTPAILKCTVNETFDTVNWYKETNILLSMALNVMGPFKKRIVIKTENMRDWNLVIERAQITDAGRYSCKVSGNVIKEIDLVILTPPKIKQIHTIIFEEGDTGSIWCNTTGIPTPDIRWYSKPPYQLEGLGEDTGVKESKLTLHNITRYYDNIYVCSATNPAGNDTAETRVRVSFGPEVEIMENIIDELENIVTLDCAIAAYPMDGKAEWAFQNTSKPIYNNSMYDVVYNTELVKYYNTLFVSLTIRKGALGDQEYGQYVCRTEKFSRGYSDKEVVIQKD